MYYCTEMKSVDVSPHVMASPSFRRYIPVNVNLVAKLLLLPVAQKRCRCWNGVFKRRTLPRAPTNISHRNRFLLFLKHLAMRTLTRKFWIRLYWRPPSSLHVLLQWDCILNGILCAKIAVTLQSMNYTIWRWPTKSKHAVKLLYRIIISVHKKTQHDAEV
jgi:hypothetical protein